MNAKKSPLKIQGLNPADYLINGEPYYLFCEYENKDGCFYRFFAQRNGMGLILQRDHNSAVVGQFSSTPDKISHVFDFIEATISRNGGLVCIAKDSFDALLETAARQNHRYPILEKETGLGRLPFRQNSRLRSNPEYSLPLEYETELKGYTVPVQYMSRESSVVSFDESPAENYAKPQDRESLSDELLATVPAGMLPDGWVWNHWKDGSGSLVSPYGKRYFSYDLTPYAKTGGIEYRKEPSSAWSVFYGSFHAFVQNAEQVIQRDVLKNRHPLNRQIDSASARKSSGDIRLSSKELPQEHSR